jgi:hypothetical protein
MKACAAFGRLDRQVERFGFQLGAVALDAGYAKPGIARGWRIVASWGSLAK